ncbi:unknown [Clostridium sp. CAG:628]|jgi:thymidylate synthase|nr:unknown [Clostridium sp. CAG:628]
MRYDVKESIYKDENLLRYLRENSGWYKRLNRNENLENMVNEMKERYGLRFRDKVDKIGTGIDIINAFMNVTKE